MFIPDPDDVTKIIAATPFNDLKYGSLVPDTNPNRIAANFGDVALRAYAHYILGHAGATAAISNDKAFIDSILNFVPYTGVNDLNEPDTEFKNVQAGTVTNANLANLLVQAIGEKLPNDVKNIVEQVIGQDATRTMDVPSNIRQPLKFIAGDIIYMNIILNKPTVIVGGGQQVLDSTLMNKYSVTENYTLKITLE